MSSPAAKQFAFAENLIATMNNEFWPWVVPISSWMTGEMGEYRAIALQQPVADQSAGLGSLNLSTAIAAGKPIVKRLASFSA
jgi:hypothetical protein